MTALIISHTEDINAAGGNIVITEPAGVAVDDLLLVWLNNLQVAAANPGAISGFTTLIDPAEANNINALVQYRVADGSEGPTYTSTVGTPTAYSSGKMLHIHQADPADPFSGTAASSTGSGTTVTLPAVTTDVAHAFAIAFVYHSGFLPTTPPAGWWLHHRWDGTTSIVNAMYCRYMGATSQSTGTSTITATGTGSWLAVVTTLVPDVVAWPTIAGMVSEVGTSLGSNNAQPTFAAPQHATAVGDLMLYVIGNDNTSTTAITVSTGWDLLSAQTAGTNIIKGGVAVRIADGGANDTLSVSGAAQDYDIRGVIIPAAEHGVVTAATDVKIAGAVATSGSANPPSLDTGAVDDYLWIAACVVDLTTASTITLPPANYGWLGFTQSAVSTSSVGIGLAALGLAATQTQDPGTFTNSTQEWIAWTIAIPPSSGAGPVTLVVQDAGHAHTAEAVALTQHQVLTVANATHAHSAANTALVQHQTLAVADATHAHSVGNVALTVSLTVQDATHAHTAGNVGLEQHQVLAVADATHGHSAGNVSLDAGGGTSLASTILAFSPLGYWKLDETSGTNANDSSPNNRDGTYTAGAGSVTLDDTAGPAGTGNYPTFVDGGSVVIADDNVWSVDTAPGLTYFAIIKPDDVSAQHLVMSKGNGSGTFEWEIFIGAPSSGALANVVYRTTTNVELLYSRTATGVVGTAWQAVAVSYKASPTIGSEYAKLFRNGNTDLWATGNVGGTSGTYVNTTAPVSIGYRADAPNSAIAFDGAIGHVAIFAGVLSSGDMATLMAAANNWLAGNDGGGGPVTLVVQDATHAHSVEAVALTQHQVLTVADAGHAHTAADVALTQHQALAVQAATHGHTAANVALVQHQLLTVAAATHGHTAANVTLATGTVPGAPTVIRPADAFGYNSQVNLTYNAPASDGGSAITGYDVAWSTNDQASWTSYGNVGVDTTPTLTGLTVGVRYEFRVRAVNAIGASGWTISEWGSTPVVATAPQTPPTATNRTGSGWAISRIDQRNPPNGTTSTSTWTGAGVRIYILDNGLRSTHNEFNSQAFAVHHTFDAVSALTSDANNHGTKAASAAVGPTVGVAYDATLIVVRCYKGDGSAHDYVDGFEWIRDNHPAGTPGIVTSSLLMGSDIPDAHGLSGQTEIDALDLIVDDIVNTTGLAFVQCMGNTSSYPHLDLTPQPGLVLVGGSSATDNYSTDSNLETYTTIIAPQEAVPTANNTTDSAYTTGSGNSFGTPLVAGAMACWLEANPDLTPRQLVDLLLAWSTKGVLGGTSNGAPNRFLYTLADVPPQTEVTLVVANSTHGHTAGNVGLTQHQTLVVADATHGHTAATVVLVQHQTLTVASSSHAHTAAAVTLTQHHVLAVDDATHGHTAAAVTLVQHQVLAVANATHQVVSDTVILGVAGALTVASATHGHTAGNVTLTQHFVLTVQNATHGHTAASVTLGQQFTLVVADATHAHSAQSVALGQHQALTVQNATHGHTAAAVALTQHQLLTVQNATHAHTATNVALVVLSGLSLLRMLTVAAEPRTLTVAAEPRTLTVAAADRHLLVEAP